MYNVVKKIMNLVCFFWWFIVISVEVHPIIFKVLMSQSLIGVLFAGSIFAIALLAIVLRKWDLLAAAIFTGFIYIGITWTTLPVSKLIKEPKWQFVPFIILVLFNLFDFGQGRRKKAVQY